MTRLLLIVALLAVCFWVYSVVDCAVQSPERHRGVSKPAWLVIVVVLPVLGGILWFAVGRMRRSAMIRERRAPDDDPDFLRSLHGSSAADDRIRRLEAELRDLDDESTPPPLGEEHRSEDDDDARGHRGSRS